MVRFIKKIRNFQFKGILMILGCFILIAAALFAERSGVQYQEKKRQISYIDKDKFITEKEAADSLKKTCLVLRDSSQEESEQAWIEFQRIFMDMRVGTDVIDVQKDTIPDLDAYETVVLLLSDLDPLKEKVLDICEWVEDGGSAMFALTLQKNTYVSLIEQKLGIISSGYENTEVDSIYFDKDFLIGGGQAYTIEDPYESAWEVELVESARVYARVGDQCGTPVIWEEDYGKGHIEGAVSLPYGKGMQEKFDILPTDQTIYVYCYSGQTASQTMAALRLKGYTVYNLSGGMGAEGGSGWLGAGYEVTAR